MADANTALRIFHVDAVISVENKFLLLIKLYVHVAMSD